MRTVSTEKELDQIIENNQAVLLYFSTVSCSVGEALEPKVEDMVTSRFPELELVFVDMNALSKASAKNQVFVEPTLLLFVEGKESMRKSRHISMLDLEDNLQRIYGLLFS